MSFGSSFRSLTSPVTGLMGYGLGSFSDAFGGMNPWDPAGLFPPGAPNAPDFRGAAEQTAQSDLEMAQQATLANRANQANPYGSLQWTQNPDGTWSQDVSFSPEQQALYDQTTQGRMDLLGQGDPNFGANRDRVIDAMMTRTERDVGQDRESMRSQLIARGIPESSEAYDREMARFDRRLEDARTQAEIAATGQASEEYGAELAGRGQRANMLMGFSPQMPQFNQFYNQQATPGADYSGAAQNQALYDLGIYNARMGRSNAMSEGLLNLGASYFASSDRRLKKNVKQIGYQNDLPLYEFNYLWDDVKHIGHMADEVEQVMPGAVLEVNGYKMVNYGLL